MSSDLMGLSVRSALHVRCAEATHRTAELGTSLCARDAHARVSTWRAGVNLACRLHDNHLVVDVIIGFWYEIVVDMIQCTLFPQLSLCYCVDNYI